MMIMMIVVLVSVFMWTNIGIVNSMPTLHTHTNHIKIHAFLSGVWWIYTFVTYIYFYRITLKSFTQNDKEKKGMSLLEQAVSISSSYHYHLIRIRWMKIGWNNGLDYDWFDLMFSSSSSLWITAVPKSSLIALENERYLFSEMFTANFCAFLMRNKIIIFSLAASSTNSYLLAFLILKSIFTRHLMVLMILACLNW